MEFTWLLHFNLFLTILGYEDTTYFKECSIPLQEAQKYFVIYLSVERGISVPST